MSIKSLLITKIPMGGYTPSYIARVFWKQNIAKVSNVTWCNFEQGSNPQHQAIVEIEEWCDSEVAYNFIQRLKKSGKRGTRIVHTIDYWWPVFINAIEEEPKKEAKVIGGKYTVDEAIARCVQLNEQIMACNSATDPSIPEFVEVFDYCEELDILEMQLRDYGHRRLVSDEKLIQYFRIPQLRMSAKDAITRVDFLKNIVNRFGKDSSALLALQDIKDEIEFLEDQLDAIVVLKSPNVTLRPHQMAAMV